MKFRMNRETSKEFAWQSPELEREGGRKTKGFKRDKQRTGTKKKENRNLFEKEEP